ncbi:MAG: hypothetical protein KJ775_08770, partial [Alphaproteobacteria bacterium]|nr:hypothetical protein [Alphaproteobacteria bacterium]MBU1512818.1 hypothetical protein [Alphaproteobacteria bacterium]MBU2093994.1 hypothetical protein [Alphaproteobacteria bacterium]
HVHACAMSTDDPTEVVNLAQAYQKLSRCVRQSLALQAQLRRGRERDARDNPPPPRPLPPTPARDAERIAERRDALRVPAQRVVWSEYEHADYDEAGYYFDLIEQRLDIRARDNTFGLMAEDDAWVVEPLDAHVVRLCRDLGLDEAAALVWRELPDPPPEALEPPDDEDDEDGSALESSA